jgi:hypothetical protein
VKFLGQTIQVKTAEGRIEPTQIRVEGRWLSVAEIVADWFDTGHGATPLKSRDWRTRHHRRQFHVKTADGSVYHLYCDYGDRRGKVWVLVRKMEKPGG